MIKILTRLVINEETIKIILSYFTIVFFTIKKLKLKTTNKIFNYLLTDVQNHSQQWLLKFLVSRENL